MKISLDHIGKKFNRTWVFRNLSLDISEGEHLALLGANGSGKSTLLLILAGYLTPSEGTTTWTDRDGSVEIDHLYRQISLCAPYASLPDELSLRENIHFHASLKKFTGNPGEQDLADRMLLGDQLDKPLRFFSSGMKQRVKLALAVLSDTPLLLLDEPCSHLDASGTAWFQEMIQENTANRTVIVASNNRQVETSFCQSHMHVDTFRPVDVRV